MQNNTLILNLHQKASLTKEERGYDGDDRREVTLEESLGKREIQIAFKTSLPDLLLV
jgi:hypothetical protein